MKITTNFSAQPASVMTRFVPALIMRGKTELRFQKEKTIACYKKNGFKRKIGRGDDVLPPLPIINRRSRIYFF
jgi:hypothetical protein